MFENGQNLDGTDKKLIDIISKNWGSFCSSCGVEKDLTKIKVIKKTNSLTQVISECTNCGMKTLITAFPNLGMHINQLRTDIRANEFEKFTTPISSNDYLYFYNEIKDIVTSKDLLNLINKGK
jgi:hypothetical protein